jgi:hypothetical protein
VEASLLSEFSKLSALEAEFFALLSSQKPQERYKQVCMEHEVEIYWKEVPMWNGRQDDIPFCPSCGANKPLSEWLVLDTLRDEFLYWGKLRVSDDGDDN